MSFISRLIYAGAAGALFAFAASVPEFIFPREPGTLSERPLLLLACAFVTGVIASLIGTTYGRADAEARARAALEFYDAESAEGRYWRRVLRLIVTAR